MSHCGFNFEDTFTGISWVGEQIMNWESDKHSVLVDGLVWFMLFNATLNNISVISWQSVLLVEETRVHVKNH